jgi:RNA polymerase sigma factor (TIGR02999 family)
MGESTEPVTQVLQAVGAGEEQAAEKLLPLVYEELRKLAAVKMKDQPAEHTLQPTALVHEVYLRLVGSEQQKWQNSRHFFAAAAEAMRQILVDWARKKGRLKRGGDWQRLNLEEVQLATEAAPDSILAVDEALEAFALEDPVKAELVKLRFFGGLSLSQAAGATGLSPATAKRYLAFSRAWLYRRITAEDAAPRLKPSPQQKN